MRRICCNVLAIGLVACTLGCKSPSKKATSGATPTADIPHETKTPVTPGAIYLTVRLRPDVAPEIIRYLATVTESSEETVAPGTPLKSVLKKNYGFDRKNVSDVTRESNPTAVSTSGLLQTTQVTLPPGPLVSQTAAVKPRGNLTARQLVQSSIGTSGETTKTAVLEKNPGLAGHWDDTASVKIILPYATHYTSYRLKTGSMSEAQKIVARLQSLDKANAVMFAEASYALDVAPSWTLAGANYAGQCSDTKGDDKWPFKSLPANWATLDQIGPVRPAIVAVLDTGLADGVNDQFPLWPNAEPGKNTTLNEFAGVCVDDFYGCNFVQPESDPIDDCSVPSDFHHGTHIAGLVSGRLFADHPELDKRLEMMIVKVADSKAQINPSAVLEGMRYAIGHGANVVNLSLGGSQQSGIDDKVKAEQTVLFVAAAGNPATGVGTNLDTAISDHSFGYPARLSKDSPNLIAVAAHDGAGNIDCFSNYGPTSVDLAAPGFEVDSIVSPATNKPLSGTSQATALVSLAAALLYSEGITTPGAIKRRLIASTDFRPALRDKVFSSGILNVEKATAFTHDILQFKDFHIETGEIISPLSISINDQANDLSLRGEVYKILPHFSTQPGQEIRVTYLREGHLVNGFTSNLGKISFRTDKGTRSVSTDDLIDIIPRLSSVRVKQAKASVK